MCAHSNCSGDVVLNCNGDRAIGRKCKGTRKCDSPMPRSAHSNRRQREHSLRSTQRRSTHVRASEKSSNTRAGTLDVSHGGRQPLGAETDSLLQPTSASEGRAIVLKEIGFAAEVGSNQGEPTIQS